MSMRACRAVLERQAASVSAPSATRSAIGDTPRHLCCCSCRRGGASQVLPIVGRGHAAASGLGAEASQQEARSQRRRAVRNKGEKPTSKRSSPNEAEVQLPPARTPESREQPTSSDAGATDRGTSQQPRHGPAAVWRNLGALGTKAGVEHREGRRESRGSGAAFVRQRRDGDCPHGISKRMVAEAPTSSHQPGASVERASSDAWPVEPAQGARRHAGRIARGARDDRPSMPRPSRRRNAMPRAPARAASSHSRAAPQPPSATRVPAMGRRCRKASPYPATHDEKGPRPRKARTP